MWSIIWSPVTTNCDINRPSELKMLTPAAPSRDENGTVRIDEKPTGIQTARPLAQETAVGVEELETVVRFAISQGHSSIRE